MNVNDEVLVYDIATENGKKFCECKRQGDYVVLSTKQGELTLLGLMEQISDQKKAKYRRNRSNDKGSNN